MGAEASRRRFGRASRGIGVGQSGDGHLVRVVKTLTAADGERRDQDQGGALCRRPCADLPVCEEAQGFGDGILVLGGAHLELQDFEITDNARVGLYLYDTAGTGFDTGEGITGAPTLDVLRGTITGNQYGINFRQGNITPSDFAGKEVACYDNAATVDGCYSEVELEVPSPSEALEGLTK